MDHPARTVGSDISVEFRKKHEFGVREKYRLFDEAITNAAILEPVLFDEDLHLAKPFENPAQRHKYFEEMQLSIPIDLFRYCPGESVVTITFTARFTLIVTTTTNLHSLSELFNRLWNLCHCTILVHRNATSNRNLKILLVSNQL